MKLTYRYRVKNLNGLLNRQARTVNFVWNYCNESQKSCLRLGKRWLTGFELSYLLAGTGRELGLHCETVRAIGLQYASSRNQQKLPSLRWRGKRSLGWIPLKGRFLRRSGDNFIFHGRTFRVFNSRPLPDCAKICDGSSFSQDARGRWYLNVVVETESAPKRELKSAVGIDLGLKDLAVLSTGEKIENPRHLQALADRLARAQRARKKRLAASIHARIQNSRRDFHHKASTAIVRRFDFVAVGNVAPVKLAKTRLAKSVLDAGWSSFRAMLSYKCDYAGGRYEEVNESYSTRVCSSCGSETGPKGVAELGIRSWTCSECGSVHDRDHNAAQNILTASGHRGLVEGAAVREMPTAPEAKEGA